MNCLCLSAALLFLLVILVDGTPVYEHHSLDQGMSGHLSSTGSHEIRRVHRRVRGRGSVVRWVLPTLSGFLLPSWAGFCCEELISLRQLENHALQEFPTHMLEEENKDSQPAFCLEPKLAGSCKNKTARYFYNAKTRCCEPFVDGGCEGNKNNFNTIDNCLKSCCPDCMKTCCTLEESQR
uniref:BPTI/Kunitz inhibitor domain-containing protein n=1 Tax=Bos indicus x Bos taurus TaxID=30522 RepID=A0A4W2EGN8_BOBOX